MSQYKICDGWKTVVAVDCGDYVVYKDFESYLAAGHVVSLSNHCRFRDMTNVEELRWKLCGSPFDE